MLNRKNYCKIKLGSQFDSIFANKNSKWYEERKFFFGALKIGNINMRIMGIKIFFSNLMKMERIILFMLFLNQK